MVVAKPFSYMRGRTFSGSFVIVDETQEITPHIVKRMLTRAGKDSVFYFAEVSFEIL